MPNANENARILSPDDVVMVLDEALTSEDPYDIIQSNIDVVNALMEGYLKEDEISRRALMSYYADYYLAQVNNGGFSQFVYNCDWDPAVVDLVRKGLAAIAATQHLALFEEGARAVDALGTDRLQEFFNSEYFGENQERDELNAINERFYRLGDSEDLVGLNAAWLKNLPDLCALNEEQLVGEIRRRMEAVPDREARKAAAKENLPPYVKYIDALCDQAGYELDRITAGDPTKDGIKWYFLTDKGLHYMLETDDHATMYEHETDTIVAQIDI